VGVCERRVCVSFLGVRFVFFPSVVSWNVYIDIVLPHPRESSTFCTSDLL